MSYRQVSRECEYMQQVSTVRTLKCHNDTLHTNQRHREEEPHNINSNGTPERQQKKSNPLSLPLQDDCNILGQNNWWFKGSRQRKQQQWRIPLKNPVDSCKTFFYISVNTGRIGMGFEAETPNK